MSIIETHAMTAFWKTFRAFWKTIVRSLLKSIGSVGDSLTVDWRVFRQAVDFPRSVCQSGFLLRPAKPPFSGAFGKLSGWSLALAVTLCGAPALAGDLTYAHVWASAPPAVFLSEGRAMLADGRAVAVFVPRAQLEANIGRYRSSDGWVRSAYSRPDLSPCIIVIASDVPAAAIANLLDHEAAHCGERRGEAWGNDHAGAMKPPGHLDACLASGLPLREMARLCMLDRGEPLTAADTARWAALR